VNQEKTQVKVLNDDHAKASEVQGEIVERSCFMFKEAQEVECSESVPGGTREVFRRRCGERPSALEIEKS
jgi:hypothetical protein